MRRQSRVLRFCRVCHALPGPCSPCAHRTLKSRRSAVPCAACTKRRQLMYRGRA